MTNAKTYYRKKTSAYKSKRFSSTKRKTAKPSKNFVKAVEKVIHKDVETKEGYRELGLTQFNSAINSSGDVQVLLPTTFKGTNDNNRIGDQMRAQKLVIKGYLMLNSTPISVNVNPGTNARVAVRMMIVQPKSYQALADIQSSASVWMGYLLKKGATVSSFDGTIPSLYAPINTDAITKYYDKVIYLSTDTFYMPPATPLSTGFNNSKSSVKFFRKTFKLRNKLLKFDDNINSGQFPTHWNPVLILGYCHLDGSSPDTVTTAVSLAYDSYLDYEDA